MTTQTTVSPAIIIGINTAALMAVRVAAVRETARLEANLLVEAAEAAILAEFDQDTLAEIRGFANPWNWLELAEA